MSSTTSDYRQQQQAQRPPRTQEPARAHSTAVHGSREDPNRRDSNRIPMPAEPVVIQIPFLVDHENYMIQVIQETRLAQLATIEQQRELIKYVQGLHEWLGRDVEERKSEREDLAWRIERLNSDVLHSFR